MNNYWSDYFGPPVAAASAVFFNPFVGYGQMLKTAQQLNVSLEPATPGKHLASISKMSATIGVLVGTQLYAKEWVKKNLTWLPYPKWSSCLVVATVSAPILAVYNGFTNNQTLAYSVRNMSAKMVGAILVQETVFLYSTEETPINRVMKEQFGDTAVAKYGSTFITGAFGAICNHPANTAITLWQNKREIVNLTQLYRGVVPRSLSIGALMVGYDLFTNQMKRK